MAACHSVKTYFFQAPLHSSLPVIDAALAESEQVFQPHRLPHGEKSTSDDSGKQVKILLPKR